MENIVELAVMAVIIILSLVMRYSRQRRTQQQNAERRVEENTRPESDGDVAPPPFMEDFPFATELEQMAAQENEDETEAVPAAAEEPEPPAPQEPDQPVEKPQPQPPRVPVESPAGIRSVPVTSLLDLSPQTFRQGIILKEILERPRSRRIRRNR
jgi:cytoskeletal protein RodZ